MEAKRNKADGTVITGTQSICPVCHRPVDAFYIEEAPQFRDAETRSRRVYFVKECPEHGVFRTLAAENAEDYKKWIKSPVINIPPKAAMTEGDKEDKSCPLHCGTCENHLQTACCVLIDLTDRCNQHCPYCFARSEEDADRSGEPTPEEIEAKYDLLLELGEERPFNIQLSGGEPTVRDDLPEIIRMARDKGFEYVQINSNGRRLALEDGYARILKEAGATVIFMQFDGTRDDIYEALRGEPMFELKKKAIRNCEKAGLAVTLVPTVVEGVNTDNIGEMMDFLVENVNVVKGIHFQPVSFFGRHPEQICDHEEEAEKGSEAGHAKAFVQADAKVHAPCGAKEPAAYGSGDFPGRITMFELLRKLEEQRPDFKYEDFCPISTGHTLCCFYSTYTREPDGSIRCMLSNKAREEGISCCDTLGESDATGGCEGSNSISDCCCENNNVGSGVSCCDAVLVDALEVIKKDRDYVLNKWEIAETAEDCCSEPAEGADACCSRGAGREAGTEETSACCDSEAGLEVITDCCCGNAESEEASCCCGEPEVEEIMDMDGFLRYYRQNTFTVTGMAFQDIMNLDAERVKRCRVQVLSEDDRLIPFCAYNSIYR